IITKLKADFGDPHTDLTKYEAASAFTRGATDSINEKALTGIAFRTYHDVDPQWYIENRNKSVYETNMADGSELVSRLRALGNKQAAFIKSSVHGRRSS